MSVPPAKRLYEIAMEAVKSSDTEDVEEFKNQFVDAIRADGFDPTKEELLAAVLVVRRSIERDRQECEAGQELRRLSGEWKVYSDQWHDWLTEMAEAEGDPSEITLTYVEDYVFIGETVMVEEAEFERVSANFVALYERMAAIMETWPDLKPEMVGDIEKVVVKVRRCRNFVAEARVTKERQERLRAKRLARRESATAPVTALCSVAGCQKPARVNDLCKTHGREAGLVPKGKAEVVLSKRERRRLEREQKEES